MASLQIDVRKLPGSSLEAAAEFYAELPEIRVDAEVHPQHDLVIVFEPAGHEHRTWRLGAIQEMAREFAPRRVNAIIGSDEDAILKALGFLDSTSAVTGQLLEVDGNPPAKG